MIRKYIKQITASLFAFSLPVVALAQFGEIDEFGNRIILFINDILVPLVFAIALLLFIWGVFVYFIQGGGDDGKREQGRDYILWAIIALVVMVSVWGITNLIAGGLGLNDDSIDGSLIPNATIEGGGTGQPSGTGNTP